jgi:hypothetical protein
MMTFPIDAKNKIHVPNHQPVEVICRYLPIKSGDFASDND